MALFRLEATSTKADSDNVDASPPKRRLDDRVHGGRSIAGHTPSLEAVMQAIVSGVWRSAAHRHWSGLVEGVVAPIEETRRSSEMEVEASAALLHGNSEQSSTLETLETYMHTNMLQC